MEESVDQVEEEIYSQGNVSHGYSKHPCKYHSILGTLRLVQSKQNGEIFIEWRPVEANVESDTQDAEWAIVTKGGKRRTLSGSSDSSRVETVRLNLSKLRTFRKSKRNSYVSLKMQDDSRPSAFFFFDTGTQKDLFVSALCQYVPAVRDKKDDGLYRVFLDNDGDDFHKLQRSFAELNLDKSSQNLWQFFGQLRENPYEATMGAFSKITDALLYRGPEQRPEEASDLLTRSLTRESADDLKSSEDYEVIQKPVEILLDECLLEPLPRRPPLSRKRWTQSLDPEGRVTDPQSIKKLIFQGGVSDDLRTEVWMFLLGVYPWNSTYGERVEIRTTKVQEYYTMKKQWETMTPAQEERFSDFRDRKSLIGKDVHRTDRALPFYAGDDNPNVETLMHILMTYVMYNFDLGYVQGMSDLLAPILELFKSEVDAFWCFVGFMDRVGSNFDMDQEGMKQQLIGVRTLISMLDPNLLSYLEKNDSGNMFFCFRWLIVHFKREFSKDDIMRIWEVLWSDLPCKNFQLLLCVAILEKEKQILYDNEFSFHEILKHVNDLSTKIDHDEMIGRAHKIYQLLSEKADDLPDCVRLLLGLPSLHLNLWVPPPLPPPATRSDQRRQSVESDDQPLPQSSNDGAGEPGTTGRTTSPGTDSERDSSIETLHTGTDAEDSFEKAISLQYY